MRHCVRFGCVRGADGWAGRSTAALILRLAYGYEVGDADADPLVRIVEVAMQGFARASEPNAFLVDHFPALLRVPEWLMPGGGFKAVARRMRRELDEMYDKPFEFVKAQMVDFFCLAACAMGFTLCFYRLRGSPRRRSLQAIWRVRVRLRRKTKS